MDEDGQTVVRYVVSLPFRLIFIVRFVCLVFEGVLAFWEKYVIQLCVYSYEINFSQKRGKR